MSQTRKIPDGGDTSIDADPCAGIVRAGLVGESVQARALFRRVVRLARSNAPVLIQGEPGTEKNEVARAIHLNSPRATGPFVAEAAARLREPYHVRHIFGHVRGAFTGASATVPGLADAADGGTLYLDEVADLAPEAQACLSRLLQTGEYRPVGSPKQRRTDLRLVASSSVDLGALVRAGQFRVELYFLLRGGIVTIPPLRERRADILPLVAQVVREVLRPAHDDAVPRLDPAAKGALLEYDWPGNTLELRQEIRQALAMTNGRSIRADVLQIASNPAPARIRGPGRGPGELRARVGEFEAATIREALRQSGGNKAEAARRLGITRRSLYRRLAAIPSVPADPDLAVDSKPDAASGPQADPGGKDVPVSP